MPAPAYPPENFDPRLGALNALADAATFNDARGIHVPAGERMKIAQHEALVFALMYIGDQIGQNHSQFVR